ncbi:hypothetical protein P3W85_18845, partial [Cupriavidus basilensis]|nr:hypothetical protein [Cupriavidus basilensis]
HATNQKVEQNTTSITNLGDTITNVAGDTSNTYVAQNGRGVKYVRTNDTGLPPDDAHALAAGATAVGYGATASRVQAVAVGRNSLADGDSGIAVGYSANASGSRSIAIGASDSRAAFAARAGLDAVGQTRASGTGSVALGAGTTTDVANSVALGSGSVGAANAAGPALFSGDAIAAGGALSIGAAGMERQIKNVAGGTNGTDAVNVNQLRAVADNAVQYDDAGKGSVTLGGTTSVDGGVTGGTRITNVHQGDV